MNWADFLIIGLIGLSMIISLFRGFIREVMALAVWVAAFWVAFTFSDNAAGWLDGHIELPSARVAVAYAGLFIATLIVGSMINFLAGKLIEQTGLTGTDRFVGLFFGAARGVVLIVAAVLFAGLTPLPKDPWWQESTLLPHFQRLSQWAVTLLPEDIGRYFDYRPEALEEPDADRPQPDPASPPDGAARGTVASASPAR